MRRFTFNSTWCISLEISIDAKTVDDAIEMLPTRLNVAREMLGILLPPADTYQLLHQRDLETQCTT